MTYPSHLSPLTQTAAEAVLKAGAILQKGFGTAFQISMKPGILNYVTEFDHAAEKYIVDTISSHYPDHSFLCEECGSISSTKTDILWLVDPLDGTTNFAHNIPIFSISVGALGPDGMICGIIYQPITQELFVAERGKGAFLNGVQLHVSLRKIFAGGLGATGFPRNIQENPLKCIDHYVDFLKQGTIIRNLGSSAINLAYVAAGRFDAYWAISLHPWDISAGVLLIEEAGGKVTTFNGEPYSILSGGPLVVTNKLVHEEVLNQLKK